MKLNFSKHDIRCLINELKYLKGSRVNKVYDIDSKSICLKLSLNNGKKKYLILDSGCKFYTLDEFKNQKKFPSSFCSKLRKHLLNKRVVEISQVNNDRVIIIKIGYDEYEFNIICEFYSSGNIILADKDLKILNVLHTHFYDKQNQIRVNYKYPVRLATKHLTNEQIYDNVLKYENDKREKLKNKLLSTDLVYFSKQVLFHKLLNLGINLNQKVSNIFEVIPKNELKDFINDLSKIYYQPNTFGYIVLDSDNNFISVEPMNYYSVNKKISFPSFEQACSEYFKQIDNLNLNELNENKNKEQKKSKHEQILNNISKQVSETNKVYEEKYSKSEIMEMNLNLFENILNLTLSCHINKKIKNVNEYLEDLDERIKYISVNPEKKIIKFKFDNDIFELKYTDNIYQNITTYYKFGKRYKKKSEKAIEKLEEFKEKKNSEKKKEEKLIELEERKKYYWFERFYWFFTTNNFLVICGKNAEQNEEIVKKYLDKGDLYIHSEVPGSGSCVIKNPKNLIIPDSDINQAGHFMSCFTKSWNSGVGDRSYWVNPEQVSKTAESGEYLTKGSFMIRGNKNIIPAKKLTLGITLLFETYENKIEKYGDENTRYCIPMVGVYESINKNKFKIKITPGNFKRGKTIKKILDIFKKTANIYEKSAIYKIKNEDFEKILRTNIRIN